MTFAEGQDYLPPPTHSEWRESPRRPVNQGSFLLLVYLLEIDISSSQDTLWWEKIGRGLVGVREGLSC